MSIPLSEKALLVVGTEPEVSIEEFLEKVWSIRPDGDPEEAYINMIYHIRTQKTFRGEPVTMELIIKKYRQLLVQAKAEGTEDKFIPRLTSFIIKRGYNKEYAIVTPERLKRLL